MSYTFKHINIPSDVHFDDDHLAFLETLDKGLVNAAEKSVSKEKFDALKEQVRHAFIEIEKSKHGSYTPSEGRTFSKKEKELNEKWLKNFFRKKDNSLVEQELKEFDEFLSTSTDTYGGGYLIPTLLQNEILHAVTEGSIARREFRYLPFGDGAGNSRKIPKESTGITVSWTDEAENKSVSSIKYTEVTQTLEKLAVIGVISEEMLEDPAVDLVAYTSRRIAEAVAVEEDAQFFAGLGVPFTGILNNADVAPYAMAAGETFNDLTADHLLDMQMEISKEARKGAKYYMNSAALAIVMKSRAAAVGAGDGEGSYLAYTPMQGQPLSLWGYPVVTVDALPDASDAGEADQPFIIFGNLQKTCVYADKKGLRLKLLTEATIVDSEDNEIHLAQADMVALRANKRVGYSCVMPENIAVLQTGSVS